MTSSRKIHETLHPDLHAHPTSTHTPNNFNRDNVGRMLLAAPVRGQSRRDPHQSGLIIGLRFSRGYSPNLSRMVPCGILASSARLLEVVRRFPDKIRDSLEALQKMLTMLRSSPKQATLQLVKEASTVNITSAVSSHRARNTFDTFCMDQTRWSAMSRSLACHVRRKAMGRVRTSAAGLQGRTAATPSRSLRMANAVIAAATQPHFFFFPPFFRAALRWISWRQRDQQFGERGTWTRASEKAQHE